MTDKEGLSSPGERVEVTAVIVTYESAEVIGHALSALVPAVRAGWLRVVVVDNSPREETAAVVSRGYPGVRLIRPGRNLGYGRGCNLGFSAVETRQVVFMNPDVVIHPEALAGLVRFLDSNPRAGAITPATRVAGQRWQHAGGLTSARSVIRQALGRGDPVGSTRVVAFGDPSLRTDWICGAIMQMRSSLFRELKGFDPRFFLYFEETDLCRRIRRAGYDLWVVGQAEAIHVGGASARKVDPRIAKGGCLAEHFFSSRYYYLSKHFGPAAAAAAESLELAAKGLRDLARYLLRRDGVGELRKRLEGPLFSPPPRP